MTTKTKTKAPRRLRAEIIEMAGDLHATGLMSREKLEKITLRMLDKDKLPRSSRSLGLRFARSGNARA